MTEETTDKGTFGGAVRWAVVMNWGQEGLTALMTFVLASILGPKAFGIVVLGLVYIFFIEMFVAQGFISAIVQRKDL